MTSSHAIVVRRVYDERSSGDGLRILVDRIWPRGLSKSAADLDKWCKEIAPSTELRQWYGHAPSRFREFRRRYLAELNGPTQAVAVTRLRALATQHDLTLLTASKAVDISHAVVLAEYI